MKLTKQEQFDRMVHHLRKQGKKAYSAGTCRYRAPKGSMCAVGCLISDEDYREEMEGEAAADVIKDHNLDISIDLAEWMQDIHDELPVKDWESDFKRVAEALNLKYTPKEDGS